jgi:hypothetical protein
MSLLQATSGGGTTGRLTYGSNAWTNGLAELSVFWWGRLLSTSTANDQIAIAKRTQDAANAGLFACLYTNDGVGTGRNIEFDAYNWTAAAGFWVFDGPQDTNWHANLVTYSYGSTSNNPTYYLDGVSKPILASNAPAGGIGSDNVALTVGGGPDGGGTGFARSWGGALTRVALWRTILTPSEAQLLAAGSDPRTIRAEALVFCPLGRDAASAVDCGLGQLGAPIATGTWTPADDPPGEAIPKGEMSTAFSPLFLPLPYRRPNLPLYRR